MANLLSITPQRVMAQHQEVLSGYARKALVCGQFLDDSEADDLALRMQEYLVVGTSFNCTERELVTLLYRGLFQSKQGCDCFTCTRRRTGQPRRPRSQ